MSGEAENPQPVIVSNPDPLPVTVAETPKPSATAENPPARATTTSEEDRHTRGQRSVNLLWEITQAVLSYGIIGVTLYVDARIAVGNVEIAANRLSALMQLNVMAGLVIGFYFGRTNHQNVGGVQIGR